jgi:predicted amidophosphoribosyltransferase
MSWTNTPMKDISFEHCGRPAYWEGQDVYCSKCQIKLEDNEIILCGDCIRPVNECGCLR